MQMPTGQIQQGPSAQPYLQSHGKQAKFARAFSIWDCYRYIKFLTDFVWKILSKLSLFPRIKECFKLCAHLELVYVHVHVYQLNMDTSMTVNEPLYHLLQPAWPTMLRWAPDSNQPGGHKLLPPLQDPPQPGAPPPTWAPTIQPFFLLRATASSSFLLLMQLPKISQSTFTLLYKVKP